MLCQFEQSREPETTLEHFTGALEVTKDHWQFNNLLNK
jgi:hypothetical protein